MAEALEARRVELGMSIGDVADRAGLTRPGLAPIRQGRMRNYETGTLRGIAEALGWRRDWYDALLAGVDPAELVTEDPREGEPSLDRRISNLPPSAQRAVELLIEGYEREMRERP